MKRTNLLLISLTSVLLLVMAMVLASCGANPPVTSTAAASSTASAAITPSTTLALNPGAASISIENFSFNPGDITVKAGTTVTWTNNDSMNHTIKADAFSSPSLAKGQTFDFKFETKGVYDYICGIHHSMKGRVTVE